MRRSSRPRWSGILAVVAVLTVARSAGADNVSLTPQAPNWTGFVGSFTLNIYADNISTGRLLFAIMEPETRGFTRFDTSSIPVGSTIDAVELVTWVSNHWLDTRPVCDKPSHVVQADVDPLVATGADIYAAIGAGNNYVDFLVGDTGTLYCLEFFEEWIHDLGPLAVGDLEAGLPNGYFTVGLQSEWPCDVSQDHLDWVGYSETLSGPDPGCSLTSLPGSRMTLNVTFTPPVVVCDVLSVLPIQNVLATKSLDRLSVELTWDADLEADGYNVWHVDTKDQIPAARSGGSGANPPTCGPTLTTDCIHVDAVPDTLLGPLLYYQD